MSIKITVEDPANTNPQELALVVALLQRFINKQTGQPIGAADLPDAGLEVQTPAQALGPDNPAAAFANDNPAAAGFVGEAGNVALAAGNPGTTSQTSVSLPPAASSAPAAAPASAPAGVKVDKHGLPWDPRIHAKGAEGPVTNADGSWRAKRAVADELVKQVEAELRATMGAPAPTGFSGNPIPKVDLPPLVPNVPPAPLPTAPGAIPTIPAAPGGAPLPGSLPNVASPASQTAGASVAPGSAGPAVNPAADFISLVGAVGGLVTAGRLTNDEVTAACGAVGVANLSLLVSRPDLVPGVIQMINAFVAARG